MVDTRKFATESDKSLLGVEGALQANAILQNRYRIEGVLGVGGMGSVYQARDMQFPDAKRYVAVKEMLHHTNDPQLRDIALSNFQREANILAGLSHPSIPTIHDYFSAKDRAYLVMEFINGSDMDNILNRHEGFLPLEQVIEWFITLCDVLAYLHTGDSPIIFRDIKPSNVMIDVFGRVRLIDFGIAKHFEPETKGTMIGTEGYAAPESYKGLATPSSDVYGVGATLHHILTAHDPRLEPPFSFAERPIRTANPEVPPELEAIAMKALAFSPEDRFKSAAEMKMALSRLLNRGGGVLASAAVAEDEGWAEDDVNRGGVEPRWKFKVEEEIRSKPAYFQQTAFVTVYDNNLYAIDTETGQMRWKYPTEDVIASSPAIAENEGLVVFGSRDQSVYAVDIRSGRIKWTFQTKGPIYSSPLIEHGHVFIGSDDANLYALRVGTGRLAWKSQSHTAIRTKPATMEDKILYGNRDGELIAVDLGGQLKWRFKARKEIISSPVIDETTGAAYFGSMDGHVYAVNLANGWSAWKVQTGRPVVSSPALGDGRIYIASASGTMYAYHPENGRELWSFDAGEAITSSPYYYDGYVYFGCNNKTVYCVDAKTGKERWSYVTGGIVPGSPHVEDSVVYIGSTDQFLYAFKA